MSQFIRGEMKSFEEVIAQIKSDFQAVLSSTGALIEEAEKGERIRRNDLEKSINEVAWLEISLRSLQEILRNKPSLAVDR
jgi:hypothetical protein